MRSETFSKLAEALAKAQGMMENAKKDSVNAYFDNTYADLASVIAAIKEPLSANGLSYVQIVEEEGPHQFLTTLLMHTSGEWISGRIKLLLGKQDMQGVGGAITYARRYGLSAMVGIAQQDDDGETSVGRPPKEKQNSRPPQQPPQQKPQGPAPWRFGPDETKTLAQLCQGLNWDRKKMIGVCQEMFQNKIPSRLNKEEFQEFHSYLKNCLVQVPKEEPGPETKSKIEEMVDRQAQAKIDEKVAQEMPGTVFNPDFDKESAEIEEMMKSGGEA